ncbi:MAG: hypothetical protein U0136_05620 [Bdellovibrionota bacterium]
MIRKHLLAVDPSLTASGWVLFSLDDALPKAAGVISPPGSEQLLVQRFNFLQLAVTEVLRKLNLGTGDLLVCEGPAPLVRNPQSALKVEGVRGVFETVARSMGVQVPGRVNPRTVQSEILGMRGKQLARVTVKDWARRSAMQLYGSQLERILASGGNGQGVRKIPQDIIDAALIGALAVARVQLALKSGASIDDVFAAQGSRRRSWGSRKSSGWTEAEVRKRFPA